MGYKQQINTINQKQFTQVKQQQKKQSKDNKVKVIIAVFFIGLVLSIALQRYICHNWQQFAQRVYGFSSLANTWQKFTVLKETMLYMGLLEFIIAMTIMSIRIGGQKICPVGEKDPLSINLLNRILSNNLEQSFVFFGLYSYLLLSQQINLQTKYIFALALLFIIGRVIFSVSYIIATIVGVSSGRSFGFAFVFGVNLLMILELIFDQTTFMRAFLFK